MTHNWTYKKLGEVVTIERGGSPRPIQDYITTAENGLNWIKIGDAVEGSKYITSTKEKIKPEGLKKTRFVHKGDFILSNSMSFGRPYILAIDGCIHDGWLVLHDENQVFDKSYLYYYLSSPSIYEEFKRLAVGGVVNNLNSDIVRKVKVAIPSLSEQESIVAELDAINHLIDLQEKQLREYDRLAQSLFYSTFGDPTTNPKGWEVKKLSDVVSEECKMSYGIVQPGDDIEDGVPVVRPIDFKDSEYIQRKGLKKTLPSISDSYKRTILRGDEILICVRGTTGTMGLATPELKGCNVTRGIVPLYFRNEMNKWFMYKYLKSNFAQNIIAENTYGATLKQINISALRSIPIMCPPLALQQTFAAQIEAIEQQKALIRRSLEYTRTLLAARMQYYFE